MTRKDTPAATSDRVARTNAILEEGVAKCVAATSDAEAQADKWAQQRWPSAHDFPERDAAREGYLAALQAPAPGLRELSDAPCDQCGYNGGGYYQPQTHPCAASHHAALSSPTTDSADDGVRAEQVMAAWDADAELPPVELTWGQAERLAAALRARAKSSGESSQAGE